MKRMPKRDVAISVKVTQDDLKTFQKAGDQLWPGAPLTRSSLVLGLARLGAESILRDKRVRKTD
jgi:hypothetical protein